MPTMLEHALKYATENLWPIFPCNRDKEPLVENGVLDATTDARQIERWWSRWPDANIGLDVGGAGMMALDYDPGHDMAQVEKNVGPVPETSLWQNTPRGGLHEFFTLNKGENVPLSQGKIADHVDVRSFHSYVLLAPSVTADGTYTWGGRGKPMHRTDEMVRVACIAKEKHEDRDTWIIEADLPENIAAAKHWLMNEAKPAREHIDGDHKAYATAAMMKSYAISPETAVDLILDYWNPRCEPPWGEDADEYFQVKVANAYKHNTSPPGNKTDAYHRAKAAAGFNPVVTYAEGTLDKLVSHSPKFTLYTRAGLAAMEPPVWLIPDLLQEDTFSILYGSWGTFKSFLALDIALSVATGSSTATRRPWPEISSPGNVLYIAGEGQRALDNRIRAWEVTHNAGVRVNGITVIHPVPLAARELEWEEFTTLAESEHKEYRLVVIDTTSRAMAGINENAQEHASKLSLMAQFMQKRLKCSVLGIGHTGHNAKADHKAGSREFENASDALISVERQGKEQFATLNNPKQKDAPEWEKPRTIKLALVDLGNGESSLAAVLPDASEIPKPAAKDKADGFNPVVKATDSVVDRILGETLQGNPSAFYNQLQLCETIAHHDDCDIPSKQLNDTVLPRIREVKGTIAHRCFHPLRSPKAGRFGWEKP